MSQFGLLLFSSTHDAMTVEAQLKQTKYSIRLISTPHTLAATCGFAIKYPLEEEHSIFAQIKEKQLPVEKRFHAEGEKFQFHYQEVEVKGD